MPRNPRKESITSYYHVMMRGINREYIYRSVQGKHRFMEMLKQEMDMASIGLVCWCLMDNHVHLVVKATLTDLSKAIKVVSIKYSSYYNKINRRIGPVFGDRYKSEGVETDAYLMAVIRYVHTIPIKAKIAQTLEQYEWSSYREYFGESAIISQTEREFVLNYFGGRTQRFAEFHQMEDHQNFLEIKEDRESYKIEYCQSLIQEYCEKFGIVNRIELLDRPDLFRELSALLLEKTGLSIRKIAAILEVSPGRVHQASGSVKV